jgi:hypothetical protein
MCTIADCCARHLGKDTQWQWLAAHSAAGYCRQPTLAAQGVCNKQEWLMGCYVDT